jgi:molybdopterin-binding protein
LPGWGGAELPPYGAIGSFPDDAGSTVWTLCFARRILCDMTLSARNRLEGKIVELQVGGVMAHVVVSVGKNLIESVITKRSVEEMKLKVGDTVSAVIKSTEVMLEKA